ncbi:MAG: TRAP transporter small permease [Thermodesulfobacteriota bacterium]
MQKILTLQKVLANILGLLVLVLMFIIVIEVCGRYLFNSPLRGGVEISQIVITWILFLPLAYALIQGAHVRVTLITMHFPPRVMRVVDVLVAIVSLAFFGSVTYVGWLQFWGSFSAAEVMPAPIWIPLWLAKLALPIGFFLFFVQLCVNMIDQALKSRR